MLTIGASHRTASSALLGDYSRAAEAFRRDVREGALRDDLPVRELAVLSTCARVEVYAVADDAVADEAARFVGREIFGAEPTVDTDPRPYSEPHPGSGTTPYVRRGPEAVRHVCRVAAGLDSFVVGEHEISGQVARAFRDAVRVRAGAETLDDVAAVAKRASGRVRSETGIGRYPASVSSVAVDIVRDRLGRLETRRALVVGAGKAGLLVARALRASAIGELTVANRSPERATEVAGQVDGDVAELGRVPELLADADVVVTATGAEGVVLDLRTVSAALRARGPKASPLLVLDLALPGDVHPAVSALDGVELLTLEDVKLRVHRHLSFRRDELGSAERLVDQVVDDFVRKQEAPDVEAVIGELRRSVDELRAAEVDRWLAGRSSGAVPTREELDRLTRSIVNKLLHEPMRRMRAAPERSGESRLMLSAARELVADTLRERLPAG